MIIQSECHSDWLFFSLSLERRGIQSWKPKCVNLFFTIPFLKNLWPVVAKRFFFMLFVFYLICVRTNVSWSWQKCYNKSQQFSYLLKIPATVHTIQLCRLACTSSFTFQSTSYSSLTHQSNLRWIFSKLWFKDCRIFLQKHAWSSHTKWIEINCPNEHSSNHKKFFFFFLRRTKFSK